MGVSTDLKEVTFRRLGISMRRRLPRWQRDKVGLHLGLCPLTPVRCLKRQAILQRRDAGTCIYCFVPEENEAYLISIHQLIEERIIMETTAQKDNGTKPKKTTTANPNTKQEEDNTIPHHLKTKAQKALTVLWQDLPPWQRDNQHIHSGYRPASNSYHRSLASLAYLHNESVNIYTHLVGALLALAAGGYIYGVLRSRYAEATREDVRVFACFFGGAVACLGMSATYHTISNHSQRVAGLGNKLDYLGYVPGNLSVCLRGEMCALADLVLL